MPNHEMDHKLKHDRVLMVMPDDGSGPSAELGKYSMSGAVMVVVAV